MRWDFLSAIATVSMDTLHLDTRSHPALNVLLWAAPSPVYRSLINSELLPFVLQMVQKCPQIISKMKASAQVYIKKKKCRLEFHWSICSIKWIIIKVAYYIKACKPDAQLSFCNCHLLQHAEGALIIRCETHTQEQYRSPVPEADGCAIDQVWAKWGASCSTRPRQSNLDH